MDAGKGIEKAHRLASALLLADLLHERYLLARSTMADDEEELDRLRDELEGMQDVR